MFNAISAAKAIFMVRSSAVRLRVNIKSKRNDLNEMIKCLVRGT